MTTASPQKSNAKASRTKLLAIAIVLIVAIVAIGVYASRGGTSSQTIQEVASSTRVSLASAVWNFTVTIDTDSVEQGQPLQLEATITNIGQANQTVVEAVSPFVEPSVTTDNGTLLWGWDQPEVVTGSTVFASGATASQNVTIPTTKLAANQTYLIDVVPLDVPSQSDLLVTIPFVVA